MRFSCVRLTLLTVLTMAVAVTTCGVVSAAAVVSVNDNIKIYNNATSTGGAGNNGEFEVFVKTGGGYNPTEDFRTFCVEGGNAIEHFSPGTEYVVIDLGRNTQSSAVPTSSPSLTKYVAALFIEFTLTKADGYTTPGSGFFGDSAYRYNRNDNTGNVGGRTDANLLQDAFWALMSPSEVTLSYVNKYVTAVTTTYSATADALVLGTNHIGGVQIINVGKRNVAGDQTVWAQDQLVYNPDGNLISLPEPSSLCLFGIGIVGAVWARRRRNAVSRAA